MLSFIWLSKLNHGILNFCKIDPNQELTSYLAWQISKCKVEKI